MPRADPTLVAAVVAVEAGNRGPFIRRVENALARVLLFFGADRRFLRLSLGIAQLQPRRLGLPCERSTIDLLNDQAHAIDACIQVIVESCAAAGLDPMNSAKWRSDEWSSFGWTFNGSRRYGEVLATTYALVRYRFRSRVGLSPSGTKRIARRPPRTERLTCRRKLVRQRVSVAPKH